MRIFCNLRTMIFAALTLLLPVCCCGGGVLRIGDATGGSELSAVRGVLFQLGMQHRDGEFSMVKISPVQALKLLREGALEAAILEKRDIPADFKGKRRDFAAEALVCCTGSGNTLAGLSIRQLKEIWQAERPVWRNYNGEYNEIHRLGLTMAAGGFTEARFLGGTLRQAGVYRSGTLSRAWLFCSPAALLCVPFATERPGTVKALQIDGIFPTAENIRSGKYPLSLRYEILSNTVEPELLKQFLKLLAKCETAAELERSGLLMLFKSEE